MGIKPERQNEKHKLGLIAILLAGSCFLTYYFHAVLGTGTVFTHLFYIPIILASLWWRRKGLGVAIFLAIFLIFSHLFLRDYVVSANDYLRALMFVVIGFVVATLSERTAKAQKRSAHLTAVLYAIRNISQLINREKDRDRLIQSVCDNLIETRGYHNAWIALLDESGDLLATAQAGLGKDFLPMVKGLRRGEITICGQKALKQSELVVTRNPAATCTDCPMASRYGGRGAITVRLEYGGKIYGLLSVSVPAHVSEDKEEQSLFEEVAGDISFALYSLKLEEERKKAEERIQHLNSALKAIRNINQLIMVEKNRDCLLQKACDSLIEARGYDAAWLGSLAHGESFATVKGSGFSEDVARFCEYIIGGKLPPCIKNALARKEMLVILDKSTECGDCPSKAHTPEKQLRLSVLSMLVDFSDCSPYRLEPMSLPMTERRGS